MKFKVIESDAIMIIGVKAEASFMTNSKVTPRLAKQFMPRLGEVTSRKDNCTLSLQNYSNFNFKSFSLNTIFEKWIGVAVADFNDVPKEMHALTITSGKYVVIDFKGSIPEFMKLWQYIHSMWLPNSEFKLDNRPHFERLPPSYSPMQEVNEEEIWIPIL